MLFYLDGNELITLGTGGLLGGGSHVAKITGVLEWLNALAPSAENDLVLMMDAYGASLHPC